ncbi:hypothetical protein H8D29_04665, partial [PVC group bacterium]|nr:hypothetical protein [PVC group bacterium]
MTIRTLTFFISLLALIVTITNPSLAFAQSADPVTVEVTGRGLTMVDARKDAIMNALRQVVGEYVESDTVIENEEIVTDTITAFTNSSDVKSEVLKRGFEEDKSIFVVCKVTIVPAQIVGKIRDAALSAVNIDGEALAAELEANHDNIKLQKDTLHNLFSGLAPRLLIARIVDRNGKPILDGRPPKDDIKMGEKQVTFALNIELYYDLQIYYERVYPNLNKVLRAVSSQYLPAEVQSSADVDRNYGQPKTAFTNYPNYDTEIERWTTRSEELKMSEHDGRIDVGPQNFVILLSRSRSRYGTEEGYDAFVLPRELRDSITSTAHFYDTLPRMRVIFESAGGDVLSRSEHAWDAFGGAAYADGRGTDERIPFSEPFRTEKFSDICTWLFSKRKRVEKVDNRGRGLFYPLVISPRFHTDGGDLIGDT